MRKFIIIIVLVLLFSFESIAQSQQAISQNRIEIDILSKSLYFYENNNIIKKYPVAVGKASTQTPVGEYKVINKLVNPYYSKKKIAGGSPQNPLGSRWMGFKPSYGIHGNNNPKSIGTFVSEGCVRMYDKDVKELYEKVTLGTPVVIKYEPIQIKSDIEKSNLIIIVYPDTYKQIPNLEKLVDDKLKELNFMEKIEANRLSILKKLLNKELVVFSDKWIYMINGNYITNDVISKDDALYVNLDKICNYLNIDILATESVETVQILNNNISIIENEGSRYITVSSLEDNLGGTHKINSDQQLINLDLSYILYNSKFVKGGIIDIEGDEAISLEAINNMFYGELSTSKDKNSVIVNNKEIEYKTVNSKPYVFLKDLIAQTNLKTNIFTKDKYIEIFSDPYIIYNGICYKGIISNRDFFIPRELLVKILTDYQINTVDECECLGIMQNMLQENEQYYSINRLPDCYKVTSDYYNRNFFFDKKMCTQVELIENEKIDY